MLIESKWHNNDTFSTFRPHSSKALNHFEPLINDNTHGKEFSCKPIDTTRVKRNNPAYFE